MHDFLTVGAPAPLQEAVAEGLALGKPYFDTLSGAYRARRDVLFGNGPILEEYGLSRVVPTKT